MILYNFRYRGPYEYDKFILNYMQIHNEVHRIKRKSFPGEDVRYGALKEEADELDRIFQKEMLEEDLSDKLHLISIRTK